LFASLEGPGIEGVEQVSKLPIFSFSNQLLLGLFLLHYFNRSIIFPMTMPEGNPMPITVMLLAFFFCTWNGFNQATSLILVTHYASDWYRSPQCIIGVLLFFVGFAANIYSDRVLFGLKEKAKAQGVQYVIPEGGLFEYVSCANYCKEAYFFQHSTSILNGVLCHLLFSC
jgi:3-oxo-5-alpha-steroid 4-dehydrogenase 1